MTPTNSRSSSFMSDESDACDKLIQACEKVVSCAPVVERPLVPYFDLASETLAAEQVQRKLMLNSSNSGRKNIRSGSPTSSNGEVPKGSRPVKVAKGPAARPPAIMTTAPHKLSPSPVRSPTASAIITSVASTPVRRPPFATAAVAVVAACPAIFKSPKPSDLPMPSSALLRRISFTDVSGGMNMMMPLALPIMAAA